MKWLEVNSFNAAGDFILNGFIALRHIVHLYPGEAGDGTWVIVARMADGQRIWLQGQYPSREKAHQEIAKILMEG